MTVTTSQATLLPLTPQRGLRLVRGSGVHVYDDRDRRYLDLAANYGVNILGHADPSVTDAVVAQAQRLLSAHGSFDTEARQRFLAALGRLLPDGLRSTYLGNSGAEAVEAALKFARAITGRGGVIATRRAYHGRTLGALSATADSRHRDPFLPLLPGVQHVAWDDVDAVEGTIDGETGAVIVEPIQGEAGVRVPDPQYLQQLRQLCDERGMLLILDEVQTAFRTGSVFAFEQSGIVPDVLCIAKGVANGLPMGVTVVRDELAERIPPGSHGSTYGGNPVCCAAGAATLERLADPLLHAQVQRTGELLRTRLCALEQVTEVRGRGLMLAVEVGPRASQVIRALQEHGVITLAAGRTAVRLLPPLILDEYGVKEALTAFAAVLG